MENITSFFLSVIASIIAYYVCKWLDDRDGDYKHEESPRGDALGLSFFVVRLDTTSFLPTGIIAYAHEKSNM